MLNYSADLPTDLPADLPADLPSDLPTDLPADIPLDLLLSFSPSLSWFMADLSGWPLVFFPPVGPSSFSEILTCLPELLPLLIGTASSSSLGI